MNEVERRGSRWTDLKEALADRMIFGKISRKSGMFPDLITESLYE
jgi:hypothetical protein